jgi:hypothetical protein
MMMLVAPTVSGTSFTRRLWVLYVSLNLYFVSFRSVFCIVSARDEGIYEGKPTGLAIIPHKARKSRNLQNESRMQLTSPPCSRE